MVYKGEKGGKARKARREETRERYKLSPLSVTDLPIAKHFNLLYAIGVSPARERVKYIVDFLLSTHHEERQGRRESE